MSNIEPTRYPNGINDVEPTNRLAQLKSLDPARYAIFLDDFLQSDMIADMDGVVASGWTQTLGTELDLDVSISGATGDLVLASEGGDNEGGQTYLNNATMQLTAGKEAFLEAKLSITAAGTIGQEELFIGLADKVTGTSLMAADGSSLDVDECWGFVSLDGEAGIDVEIHDNDVDTVEADVGTLVSATDVTLTLHYDGTDTHAYVDGAKKATIVATHPTGDAQTFMIHFKSGEAEVKTLTIDYVFVALER